MWSEVAFVSVIVLGLLCGLALLALLVWQPNAERKQEIRVQCIKIHTVEGCERLLPPLYPRSTKD